MLYPLLTILSTLILILSLMIVAFAFFGLIRRWIKVNYFTAIKALGVYWVIAVIVYYLFSIFSKTVIMKSSFVLLGEFLFITSLFYLIFHLITKRFFLLKIKQSFFLFVIVVFVVSPVLGFIQTPAIEMTIQQHDSLINENREMTRNIMETGSHGLFHDQETFASFPFKILSFIERGTITWPAEYATQLLFSFRF